MNWADYAIVGILALSVLIGLWRGFVSEVLALGVWIAAVWVAWMFGGQVAGLFEHSVSLPSARMLLGYGICFIGVLILGALLRFVMHKLVEGTGLSGSDRILGMAFGLARGVLVVVLVVMLLGFTPFPRDPWWKQSQLLPSFRSAAQWLAVRLPDNLEKYIDFHPAVISRAVAGELLPAAASTARAAAPAATAVAPQTQNHRNR